MLWLDFFTVILSSILNNLLENFMYFCFPLLFHSSITPNSLFHSPFHSPFHFLTDSSLTPGFSTTIAINHSNMASKPSALIPLAPIQILWSAPSPKLSPAYPLPYCAYHHGYLNHLTSFVIASACVALKHPTYLGTPTFDILDALSCTWHMGCMRSTLWSLFWSSWSSFIIRPSTSLFNYHSMGWLPLVTLWAQLLEGGHCHVPCTILAVLLICLSNVQLSQSGTDPLDSTWTSGHNSQLAMKPWVLSIDLHFYLSHSHSSPFIVIILSHFIPFWLSLFNTCVFSN